MSIEDQLHWALLTGGGDFCYPGGLSASHGVLGALHMVSHSILDVCLFPGLPFINHELPNNVSRMPNLYGSWGSLH